MPTFIKTALTIVVSPISIVGVFISFLWLLAHFVVHQTGLSLLTKGQTNQARLIAAEERYIRQMTWCIRLALVAIILLLGSYYVQPSTAILHIIVLVILYGFTASCSKIMSDQFIRRIQANTETS